MHNCRQGIDVMDHLSSRDSLGIGTFIVQGRGRVLPLLHLPARQDVTHEPAIVGADAKASKARRPKLYAPLDQCITLPTKVLLVGRNPCIAVAHFFQHLSSCASS